MATALDSVAANRGQTIELIGYSGGAAIAVALAARRKDVTLMVTVAGNLDTEAVNRYHRDDAMPASLNPVSLSPQLAGLPQLHLVGARDKLIPASVATGFIAAGALRCAEVESVAVAGHEAGWVDYWRSGAAMSRRPRCLK